METAQNDFAPETCHQRLLDTLEPALAYAPERDYQAWLQAVDARLRELLGPTPSVVPLNIRQEEATERDFYRETRFVFTSEPGADVPCHLLTPLNATEPLPLIICLQGHTSGMHISLGRPKSEGDERMIAEGDRDFALQAVREGYAALVMEQRCFGERRDARAGEARHVAPGCHHASMTALLLGRTMIGERVWDVRRAIDALAHFAEIDTHRIGCMGNSGGGTITWFAACVEPRLPTLPGAHRSLRGQLSSRHPALVRSGRPCLPDRPAPAGRRGRPKRSDLPPRRRTASLRHYPADLRARRSAGKLSAGHREWWTPLLCRTVLACL